MDCLDLRKWLRQNGGPVIRLQTDAELWGEPVNLAAVEAVLLENETVRAWLSLFKPEEITLRNFHGSFDTCFENYSNRLTDLGLRAGMPALDERAEPLLRRFGDMVKAGEESGDAFPLILFAGSLLRAGYRDEHLADFVRKRLDFIHDFTKHNDFTLHDDPGMYQGIPTAFKRKPVIRPALYQGGRCQFPLLFDMVAFAAAADFLNETEAAKVGQIVDYILDPRYQAFPDNYGIVISPNGRYYSMGWAVRLHGTRDSLFLRRLELMSHFPNAVKSPWFAESLGTLEVFRTPGGAYRFPGPYLTEKEGYWV